MLPHFAAALGVLGLLTIVPGPDMARWSTPGSTGTCGPPSAI
ncbi:hypothetical protein [Streptomyces sp. NBC_01320]|nr:hypothetical protein OG395_56470 [Streptomyces sp. NBC_01320]